jgi:hypothetical protein
MDWPNRRNFNGPGADWSVWHWPDRRNRPNRRDGGGVYSFWPDWPDWPDFVCCWPYWSSLYCSGADWPDRQRWTGIHSSGADRS